MTPQYIFATTRHPAAHTPRLHTHAPAAANARNAAAATAAAAAAERLASLRGLVERSHRRLTDLKDSVANLFAAVFAHRFRDVSEGVRAIVVGGIGSWMAALPETFLQDGYLKYLAWALSDRCDAVVWHRF